MNNSHSNISFLLLLATFITALAALCFLANVPADNTAQGVSGFFIVGLLLLLRIHPRRHGFMRILFIGFAVFLVLRYLNWRTLYTLSYHDVLSFAGTIALYLAELYGIAMFLISVFVNVRPIQREPTKLPNSPSKLPNIDVFIPTYNEDVELVKITLVAATAMRYPADKLKVYLLDDGGTAEKIKHPDTKTAGNARKRRDTLRTLCNQLNVIYLTRQRNNQAKAGNLNAALDVTHGDLIAIFDADHVPTVDFLEKTVGGFIEDPKLFLVQTPHYFINPDPIEKNLEIFRRMPSESHMFFMNIQPALDFWDSSFFCGSAAVLRREAIVECGGFACETITEDAESAMMLHNKDWHSRYLNYPLISGLQPETFSSFIIQRMRWAQGMVQLFVLKNPLKQTGLRFWQKICYLSNTLFWFFPFSRLVFLVAPAMFLIFGLKIYDANTYDLLVYVIPYLLSLIFTADYMFGKVRWTLSAEIYEIMQSFFSLRAIVEVIRNPKSPKFSVTPKAEKLESDFISPLSKPFYWVITFNIIAFFFGLWHFYQYFEDPQYRGIVVFALFWGAFNVLILMASLGALYERRQRRANPRIPADIPGELVVYGNDGILQIKPIVVNDFSVGGTNIAIDDRNFNVSRGSKLKLRLETPISNTPYELEVLPLNTKQEKNRLIVGLKFNPHNLQDYRNIVLMVHGDSNRWARLLQNQDSGPGILPGLFLLLKIGIEHGYFHLVVLMKGTLQLLLSGGRQKKVA